MGVKIELLREKLKGVHVHDTKSVGVWDVMGCPFCDAANGFVGGCKATLDYLKVGVLQCRADFRHAGWVSGTGYANMVNLKFHDSEILIHPTIVPGDKLNAIMVENKTASQVMVASDLHLGKITSIPKWVYQPKYDGMEGIGFKSFSEYALDDGGKAIKEKAGEPSKQKSKALVGGVPKVFPKVLENPRSEWGKALKEKLKKK